MKKILSILTCCAFIVYGFAQKETTTSGSYTAQKQQLNLYSDAFQLIEQRNNNALKALDPSDTAAANRIKQRCYKELTGLRQMVTRLSAMSFDNAGPEFVPLAQAFNALDLFSLTGMLKDREIVSVIDKRPETRLLAARLHRINGDFTESERYYRSVMDQSPGNIDLWGELVQLLGIMDKTENAVSSLQKEIERIDSPEQKSALLLLLGQVYLDGNNAEEAETALSAAIGMQNGLANSSAVSLLKTETLATGAKASVLVGDIAKAESRLDEAARSINQATNATDLLPLMIHVAENYETIGAVNPALEIVTKGLLLYDQLPADNFWVRPGKASALALSARLCMKSGDTGKAKAHFEKAITLFREPVSADWFHYHPKLASALSDAGVFYMVTGENDKALASLKEALEIGEELADKFPAVFLGELAGTLNHLGRYYQENSNPVKAEQSYSRALEVSRQAVTFGEQKHLPVLAAVLNNYGSLKTIQRDFEKAEAFLSEALEYRRHLHRKVPERWQDDLVETLVELAAMFNSRKNYEKAALLYEEAASLVSEAAVTASGNDKAERLNEIDIDHCIVLFRLMSTDPQPGHKDKALALIANAQSRINDLEMSPELQEQYDRFEHMKNLWESFDAKN